MEELKGKLDFEVKDWSKIKYMVKCHWGVKVTSEYPAPVIHEYYFEHFHDVQEFVNWYETENSSINKKIIRVQEVGKIFNVETFQVYKRMLQEQLDNGDQEDAHIEADRVLCQIALNTELTREERHILVSMYNQVEKWFA